MNKGWFRKGQDKRRHKFTREECSRGGSQPTCHRLTREHRSMGGRAAWVRAMAEYRVTMNLPLPSPKLRKAAREFLEMPL
jgi:hypothetical protein